MYVYVYIWRVREYERRDVRARVTDACSMQYEMTRIVQESKRIHIHLDGFLRPAEKTHGVREKERISTLRVIISIWKTDTGLGVATFHLRFPFTKHSCLQKEKRCRDARSRATLDALLWVLIEWWWCHKEVEAMVHHQLERVRGNHCSFGYESRMRKTSIFSTSTPTSLHVHLEQDEHQNEYPIGFDPNGRYLSHRPPLTCHRNALAERISRLFRDPTDWHHSPNWKQHADLRSGSSTIALLTWVYWWSQGLPATAARHAFHPLPGRCPAWSLSGHLSSSSFSIQFWDSNPWLVFWNESNKQCHFTVHQRISPTHRLLNLFGFSSRAMWKSRQMSASKPRPK